MEQYDNYISRIGSIEIAARNRIIKWCDYGVRVLYSKPLKKWKIELTKKGCHLIVYDVFTEYLPETKEELDLLLLYRINYLKESIW